MKWELSQTGEFCVDRYLTDSNMGCRGRFKYLIDDNGYIIKWKCTKCGYTYRPTYRFKRNVEPLHIREDKCKYGKCGICIRENKNGIKDML